MSFVAAAIVGGVGIASKLGMGIAQGAKARSIEKKNPFIKEELNPLLTENLAQARIQATTGMPSAQYNQSEQQISRGTATYLRAYGKSGRGNLLSAIRAQNDALTSLNVVDGNIKLQNQARLSQARSQMAGEQSRLFDSNVRQPYMYQRGRAADARAASSANIGGAIETATQFGALLSSNGAFGSGGFGNPGGPQLTGVPSTVLPNPFGGQTYSSAQNPRNLLNFAK